MARGFQQRAIAQAFDKLIDYRQAGGSTVLASNRRLSLVLTVAQKGAMTCFAFLEISQQ
jgi:hypothetical protein